ncbi:MAG: C25 family cysteine peptidase, partial [Anaerolineae bacterium]
EIQCINITDTHRVTELSSGQNNVSLIFDSSSNAALIFLNRITVNYQRQLTADGDELIFTDLDGGARQFRVNGFSETNPANVLVWNVTVPTTTLEIPMTGHISGDTYNIGSSHAAGAEFIATTINNVHTPTISQYVPTSLEPAGGGTDWLAITHADFAAQAQTLASHRASFSNLQTMVVDIEDIVNQYGYGLPLPSAIRDYLNHSLSWTPQPHYVVIFGGATLNPRNLDCQSEYCPGGLGIWDKDQKTFVVTDLVYEDRFQGLIPSDHSLVMLDNGNDPLLPDMAIGRIPANTAAEAGAAVAKIIQFETNQLTAAPWQKNILFVADNADGGGNFCQENQNTIDNHIPGNYQVLEHCLPDDSTASTEALRNAMLDAVNADCLDGNFAFPGLGALSTTLLTLKSGAVPVGTAAHWSSTGLGYTDEHSILQQGFYDGLFKQDKLTIGDAIDYAKINYHNTPNTHDSEMYSFLLQGDPAMSMFTMRNELYLPAITK